MEGHTDQQMTKEMACQMLGVGSDATNQEVKKAFIAKCA
jgi:DnaJ-class molecular chaperone